MARKSQRLSAGAATVLPSHKRTASNTSLPGGDAKKSRYQKATPTKSQYFSKDTETGSQLGSEDDEDELAKDEDEDEDDDPPSAPEEDLSEFGSAPESDDAEDDDDGNGDDDEEYESEVEKLKPRKKSSSTKTTAGPPKKQSGGELWREGVKTGLGPGQEVIIKKPKARPAGKVPYSDETIHPNTLLFLKDLKGNNNREWLKSEYHSCHEAHAVLHHLAAQCSVDGYTSYKLTGRGITRKCWSHCISQKVLSRYCDRLLTSSSVRCATY
jgi:hypothetical protein